MTKIAVSMRKPMLIHWLWCSACRSAF